MITLKSSVYKEPDFYALLAVVRVGKNAICGSFCDKCKYKMACYDLNAFESYLEEKLNLKDKANTRKEITK
jgi:hypothetical protein